MKEKAFNLSLGDKIKHENGLCYEIREVSENRNGKIKFLFYPYQNSMSAVKHQTVAEKHEFDLCD